MIDKERKKYASPRPIYGRRVVASYRVPEDGDHRGNPAVEALPPVWDWDDPQRRVHKQFTHYIPGNKALQGAPSSIRKSRLVKIKLEFFQVFKCHRYIEENLSISIRNGYTARNPRNPRFRRNLHDQVSELTEQGSEEIPPIIPASSLGFALLGAPGMGKTITVAKALRTYPQVIVHRNYPGDPTFQHDQVVWLFLTSPHDSSTKGLCLQFFIELDAILGTDFYRQYRNGNEDTLMAAMATVAGQHSLGLLAIDEIQFLSAAKSGGKKDLMKFFVQLQNTIGIPVVLVGTHAAAALVAGSPHQARRSVGIGGATWDRFAPDDEEWLIFLEALWAHQVLERDVPFDPGLIGGMYRETQGIPNYAVDLWYFAQREAIDNGTEVITPDSLTEAARKHMQFNRPYIHALRSNDAVAAYLLEDVVSADYENHKRFAVKQLEIPLEVENNQPQSSNTNSSSTTEAGTAPQNPECAASNGDAIAPIHPPPPKLPVTGPIQPKPRRPKRGKKVSYPAGSLMALCEAAMKKQKVGACEALRSIGFLRAVTEYMPTSATAQMPS